MTWLSKGSRLAQFAVLAIAAGELSAAVADVLVLRSVGPSARRYPAGQRVPDSATFTLRPGDSVVILASGGTRTFRGPGTYSATGPARAGQFASSGPRRNTGATRTGSGEVGPVRQPTDMWHHNVTASGRLCVPTGGRPTLWRPNADAAVDVTITPQTGPERRVSWPRGQATLAWPAAIPIADGASYQLNWTGASAPTRFTARVVQPLPASDVEGIATALLTNQCRGQLDVLIAQRDLDAQAAAPRGGGAAQ